MGPCSNHIAIVIKGHVLVCGSMEKARCWLWHVVAVGKWLLHDNTATKISEFT